MALKEILKKEGFKQFIKFAMVGVIGVSTNYSIFFILYAVFSVYYIVASAAGFILGILLVFFLNKKFTFNVKGTSHIKSMLIKYYAVNVGSTLVGLALLSFLVEILGINVYLSNFLIIGVTTFINFFGSKLFVFVK